VNGIAITSASNSVSEAIQGVTLTLKNITATPANLTIARDTAAINTAASGFVEAYNALTSQIKSRSAYGTGGTGKAAFWQATAPCASCRTRCAAFSTHLRPAAP
jgi:flagellar hook-associated protein 2